MDKIQTLIIVSLFSSGCLFSGGCVKDQQNISLRNDSTEYMPKVDFRSVDTTKKIVEPSYPTFQNSRANHTLPNSIASHRLSNDFGSSFGQLTIGILALFGLLFVFRLEFEGQKLLRTYDNAKAAIRHLGCLDKDVKFYLFERSVVLISDFGSRDIRIQILNLEDVKRSATKLLNRPSLYVLSLAFLPLLLLNHNNYDWLLLFLLVSGMIWMWMCGNKLTMDTSKLIYNVPNPYERFETWFNKEKYVFLGLAENIDLIERDILEFNGLIFVMNNAFKEVEKAIKNRKSRLNRISYFINKGYMLFEDDFRVKLAKHTPENEILEVRKIIREENSDRSKIVSYLVYKFKISESKIRGLSSRINADIIEQVRIKRLDVRRIVTMVIVNYEALDQGI